MALRVARGLFRLWLVLSVLWIGGVGVVTWKNFPEEYVPPAERQERNPPPAGYVIDPPSSPRSDEFEPFDPDKYLAFVAAEERREAIWFASLLAFLPPAFVLALGSALVWAIRGFRQP
jgi:hypothetical protein